MQIEIMIQRPEELRRAAEVASHEAARLRREAAEIEKAEEEARKPQMPEVDRIGGARVVLFEKYQSGRSYAYAAVGWRVDRHVRWAVTGSDGCVRHNWPSLLNFIGEANWPTLRLVTGVSPLLKPGQEGPVAERMGSFGRVVGTETNYEDYDSSPFDDSPYHR